MTVVCVCVQNYVMVYSSTCRYPLVQALWKIVLQTCVFKGLWLNFYNLPGWDLTVCSQPGNPLIQPLPTLRTNNADWAQEYTEPNANTSGSANSRRCVLHAVTPRVAPREGLERPPRRLSLLAGRWTLTTGTQGQCAASAVGSHCISVAEAAASSLSV